MTDIVDAAQVQIEAQTAHPIKRPEGPAPVGYCLNCGPEVKLAKPLRWCDADCQSDWTRRQRR